MNIALMTNNYKPFIGGVPISVECLAKSTAHYHEEAVARRAVSLYNKVIAAYGLHNRKLTRKARTLQWNGNIIF
ncbi:MAG: hypothetical protein IJZ34_07175 [Lachnospiraceae bacterium]|nr:hypothetical protein [Lachnospiraceae bacterium]